jgi:hypothetical protein
VTTLTSADDNHVGAGDFFLATSGKVVSTCALAYGGKKEKERGRIDGEPSSLPLLLLGPRLTNP